MGGGSSKDETLRLSATDNMPPQDDPETGRVTTPKSPPAPASNVQFRKSGLAKVESRLFKAASNAFSGDTNAQLRESETTLPRALTPKQMEKAKKEADRKLKKEKQKAQAKDIDMREAIIRGDDIVHNLKLIAKADPARLRAADKHGHTPMHIAAEFGKDASIEALIGAFKIAADLEKAEMTTQLRIAKKELKKKNEVLNAEFNQTDSKGVVDAAEVEVAQQNLNKLENAKRRKEEEEEEEGDHFAADVNVKAVPPEILALELEEQQLNQQLEAEQRLAENLLEDQFYVPSIDQLGGRQRSQTHSGHVHSHGDSVVTHHNESPREVALRTIKKIEGWLLQLNEEKKALHDILQDEMRNRWTPLLLAACYGQVKAAKLLVKHRADVNLADRFGQTPLWFAAYRGEPRFVEFLLASGADAHPPAIAEGLAKRRGGFKNIEVQQLLRDALSCTEEPESFKTEINDLCLHDSIDTVTQLLEEPSSGEAAQEMDMVDQDGPTSDNWFTGEAVPDEQAKKHFKEIPVG